jgi:hypothetical protein
MPDSKSRSSRPTTSSLNDDYFIKNAILCWLHHYPNHQWTGIYKELAERDSYVTKSDSDDLQSQPNETKPVSRKQSRGRSRSTKPVES